MATLTLFLLVSLLELRSQIAVVVCVKHIRVVVPLIGRVTGVVSSLLLRLSKVILWLQVMIAIVIRLKCVTLMVHQFRVLGVRKLLREWFCVPEVAAYRAFVLFGWEFVVIVEVGAELWVHLIFLVVLVMLERRFPRALRVSDGVVVSVRILHVLWARHVAVEVGMEVVRGLHRVQFSSV